MKRDILVGDAVERLRELPDSSVDVCCTSPPYWALRDYGVPGQLGLEPSWREHMQNLKRVFAEVRRVLKPTGNLWVNYGDTVATGAGGARNSGGSPTNEDHAWRRRGAEGGQPPNAPNRTARSEDPRKHKLGLAWRLRFMLNDELGLISRSDVVWHKPNSMPLSMKDRLTPKYESLFHLVREPRYYFDLDAIRRPFSDATIQRVTQATFWEQDGGPKDYGDGMSQLRAQVPAGAKLRRDKPIGAPSKGAPMGQRPQSANRFNVHVRDAPLGVSDMKWGALAGATEREVQGSDERGNRTKTMRDEQRDTARAVDGGGWRNGNRPARTKTHGHDGTPAHPRARVEAEPGEPDAVHELGANPGDVWDDLAPDPEEEDAVGSETWTIPNQPFSGAHFATYPQSLVERVLLCSCPSAICTACGTPRRNVYESRVADERGRDRGDSAKGRAAVEAGSHRPPGTGMIGTGRSVTRRIGTKGCECGAPTTPGVVLDPFAGSFTTCLVAAKMGLGFIGIELSEKYVEIGRRRLAPYMRPLSSFDGEAEA